MVEKKTFFGARYRGTIYRTKMNKVTAQNAPKNMAPKKRTFMGHSSTKVSLFSHKIKMMLSSKLPELWWLLILTHSNYIMIKVPGLAFILAESILWTLAYKVSNGTGESSYEAWAQSGTHHGGAGCSHNPANTCESMYKSPSVDAWSDVKEVIIHYKCITLEFLCST